MNTTDRQGRPWAKLSELKVGDIVELDGGFTCQEAGVATVHSDEDEKLYFICGDGRHYLSGQADDGEHCVGVYRT